VRDVDEYLRINGEVKVSTLGGAIYQMNHAYKLEANTVGKDGKRGLKWWLQRNGFAVSTPHCHAGDETVQHFAPPKEVRVGGSVSLSEPIGLRAKPCHKQPAPPALSPRGISHGMRTASPNRPWNSSASASASRDYPSGSSVGRRARDEAVGREVLHTSPRTAMDSNRPAPLPPQPPTLLHRENGSGFGGAAARAVFGGGLDSGSSGSGSDGGACVGGVGGSSGTGGRADICGGGGGRPPPSSRVEIPIEPGQAA